MLRRKACDRIRSTMTTMIVGQDYSEATQTLAEWHGARDFTDLVIYSLDDPVEETVRLIEISPAFPTIGEIVPVTFGKSSHFPFRSSVVQVSRKDWDRIEAGDLLLPEGWGLSAKRQVWPR